MNKKWRKLFSQLIFGPIVPVLWLGDCAYHVLFGWLDVRATKAKREKFELELKEALPFLFGLRKGVVVPSVGIPFPEPFDYATVTVSYGKLFFRFSRGRGELRVNVAPSRTPNDWHDVHTVLAALDASPELPRRRWFFNLQEIAALLDQTLVLLSERFTSDAIGEIDRRLVEFDKADSASMREWEFQLNSRLR